MTTLAPSTATTVHTDRAALVGELWSSLTSTRGGVIRRAADRLRRVFAVTKRASVPFGDGDTKTAAPGTYRPVGATCASRCPYLNNGCYAQGGKVALAERRASEEREAALNGAAAAMVWAARSGRIARLHVSGDMGGGDAPDLDYVNGLIEIANAVNDRAGRERGSAVAWTYTHHEATFDTPWIADLRAAGIHVRISDSAGHNGVIVARFDSIPALRRETGAKIAKCPAQLRNVTCADCTLCWTRPDLVVAFDPHGGRANAAARAARID